MVSIAVTPRIATAIAAMLAVGVSACTPSSKGDEMNEDSGCRSACDSGGATDGATDGADGSADGDDGTTDGGNAHEWPYQSIVSYSPADGATDVPVDVVLEVVVEAEWVSADHVYFGVFPRCGDCDPLPAQLEVAYQGEGEHAALLRVTLAPVESLTASDGFDVSFNFEGWTSLEVDWAFTTAAE